MCNDFNKQTKQGLQIGLSCCINEWKVMFDENFMKFYITSLYRDIVTGGCRNATVHDPKPNWNAQTQQSRDYLKKQANNHVYSIYLIHHQCLELCS